LEPERTSRKIIRAIERNRDFRGIPFGFHFIRLMQGLFPTVVFDWLFGKVLGIYSAMDNFKGRKE
jgi:all-trans-retinol dehydrogenase (NAD+)